MKFFYGIDGTGVDMKMGDGYVENICISAALLWSGRKFRKLNPPDHKRLFLDSGGFTFFSKTGEYPFTVEQYANLSSTIDADYVACMDYPCEDSISRSVHKTNSDRINATIENTIKCHEIEGPNWVTVIQGDHVSEYMECCKLIKENNLETPLMAVGSICRRRKVQDLLDVLVPIKSKFSSYDLHGFGVDLRQISDRRVRWLLWSSDSQAWRLSRNGRLRFPRNTEDKIRNFNSYKKRIDSILYTDAEQVTLPKGVFV